MQDAEKIRVFSYHARVKEMIGFIQLLEGQLSGDADPIKPSVDRVVGLLEEAEAELAALTDEQAEGEPPTCAIHQLPMVKQQRKDGSWFWSCHQKNEDGSWCSYRPPKA